MLVWRRLSEVVAAQGAAVLVSVHAARGSAPREAGARMVVRPDGAFFGTIGGGQLEWQALAAARDTLSAGHRRVRFVDHALGPDLGQCCGGRVTLAFETFDRRDADELAALARAEREGAFVTLCRIAGDGRVRRDLIRSEAVGLHETGGAQDEASWRERHDEARTTLMLFGAGHVGRALALALAPLPFAVRWIDSRDDAFPPHIPANAAPVRSDDPVAEIGAALPGDFVLVMTHLHALDLAITAAALARDDLPFVGLIGSDTKRARFERRFRELGIAEARIAALACPIGLAGIAGKEPAIIAASVAAQLLRERQRLALAAVTLAADAPRR